jgi:hypothetical protein
MWKGCFFLSRIAREEEKKQIEKAKTKNKRNNLQALKIGTL